jgi:outer membrane receptor protein involved in Fe transport
MKYTQLLGATALLSTLVVTPAWAQSPGQEPSAQTVPTPPQNDSTDQPVTGVTDDPGTEVTVTGSRIRRPNDESQVPVTSINSETFFETGRNNIADTLNDLPQLRNTFSQQNVGAGVGVAGLSLLDLRGLGTSRTLVLVNGRRHVGSDVGVTTQAVDVNSIPADLIERVDIVTGGSSAVYGSDAIAGVVNFVLRRNYDGFQIRGNAGIAEAGFGGNQYISALAGKNFAGGRGNIALHAEFARQERVFGSDIPNYDRVDGFGVTDVDPSIAGGNSDGFPDLAFFRDFRSGTNNRFGFVGVNQSPSTPICGTALGPTNGGPGPGANPTAFTCAYNFTPEGRLQLQTGTRFGSAQNASYIGGNGQTGREEIQLSVIAPQERYNANLLARFEFSPMFEVFLEGKYSRVNGAGVNVASEFITGIYTQFDFRERVRLDNPFLNPADRATLAAAILASGCNTSNNTVCSGTRQVRADGGIIGGPLNDADRAAIAAGTYRFAFGKTFLDAGLRDQIFRREVYRAVGGFRGTVLDDWTYEVAASYGEFREKTRNTGFFDKQRFVLSFDAARNPATGQIQCRSQFDPAARIAFPNNAVNQARLAADIAACVPYNPFGNVSNPAQASNQAATQYFTAVSNDTAKITQINAVAFMAGDTSGFFNLPGGPVRFSLGAEYRRDKAQYNQDPFTNDGNSNTTFLSGLGFDAPATEVKESFGEIQVPLLGDMPFIHELSVSAAGRISDYNNSAGVVYSYNYGGVFAPVRDLRLRVQYGRAVRAPNVSETSTPLVPNFANTFADPCRANSLGSGSQFRQANCQAALGPLLTNPGFAQQQTYNLKVLSGSNPNLQEETSDSWTIGGVFQPRFLRNFSLSVDYFNIKVNNVVTSVTAQVIANSCYDLESLDNPFCDLITRNLSTAAGPDGELPGQILSNTLIQAPLNFAKLVRRGIDSQLSYRTELGTDASLGINLVYTHVLENSNFTNPQNPNFTNVLLREIGNPQDEFRFDANLTLGNFGFGYRGRFIGKQYLNTFEDFNSVDGRSPENSDRSDIIEYPVITYHDLRFEWNLDGADGTKDRFQFFGGVDNVLDQKPPLGLTATAGGGAIYDVRGRAYYAGFRARF